MPDVQMHCQTAADLNSRPFGEFYDHRATAMHSYQLEVSCYQTATRPLISYHFSKGSRPLFWPFKAVASFTVCKRY